MGVLHVGQAGLELLTSGDPPALASQSARITGVSHRTQQSLSFFQVLRVSLFLASYPFTSHPSGFGPRYLRLLSLAQPSVVDGGRGQDSYVLDSNSGSAKYQLQKLSQIHQTSLLLSLLAC